jgi:hypothetical protein
VLWTAVQMAKRTPATASRGRKYLRIIGPPY